MVKQETWSYSAWLGKSSIHCASHVHIVFQLHDVLRFDSTLVFNVLINISSANLNNQNFLNFEV